MNTNDTQQKHSYHEFIENFSFLFKEIKKDENLLSLLGEVKEEDKSIYNAVAGFNTVKFLTEHADWNWDKDENKNKAYEVIPPEWDKIKKTEQKLESEVKKRLKDYIDDGVTAVSIYGNHASITLGDDKKEFKISEFLNSDFCEKNGISGFSTLHSDGKGGMHGFVAEEEGKKIRHYVVTDGSYEMTLKWYGEKGEEYKIKINIKADGVEFIEGNITKEQLQTDPSKANNDVKICGLFLHQIQFREKGKVNEVQHDGKDNQVLNKSSEIAIKSNSRDIEQEVKKPVQKHQATHMNREIGSQTPPLPPLRTSSLPPKENVVNEQGRNASAKPVSQDGGQRDKQNNPTPNNQQKGATSDPSDSSTFTKSVSHNQDNRQEDERYDNPTFGYAVPESQKPDRSEQTPNNQQQPETQQQEEKSEQEPKGGKLNYKKGESSSEPEADGKSELSSNTADVAQKRFLEDVLEKIEKGSQYDPIRNWLKDKIEGKENNQNLDALEKKLSPKSDQSDVVETRENNNGRPQFANPADQVMSQLKDVLEKPDKELKEPARQITEENIPKDLFSENVLEKIKEEKPIYKWLKDKIEGKENNQNLDALEGKLSKKYGQGNIIEKRENDDGKPLSPVSTERNKESLIDVEQGSDARSQKSSCRSGQEPEEERLNYQNVREALESWKEKRPKKYEINEDVKETSFNTPEKIQSELQKDDLADVKTVESPTVSVSASTPNSISDSGYISPTNNDSKSQTDLKQVGRKLEEHIRQSNLTLFAELKNTLGQENLGLKPADQSQISEETKKRLREDGLLKDSSTDVKTNDSGYSSPTHANHEQSQVNPGQLKASLMNVEQKDDTLLTEFTSKLDKETQKFPLKPLDQKEMSEQTKEHLLAAGLLKDSSTDIKTVAEQENNDTNSIVDKNSNLYKLLEKDEAQLKIGVIEEERKDTLTEHTDSYDRNRIALGNRNKRPLDWAKRIAESQEKDTNKSILM